MTPNQIKNIHIAKNRVGMSDELYRSGMEIIAGVRSSKELDNSGYEAVMAWMEDLGWCQVIDAHPCPGYWRAKVGSPYANTRLQHKIQSLYATYDAAIRRARAGRLYPLASLIGNATEHRTEDLRRLYPREAMNLIEMLKDLVSRTDPQVLHVLLPVESAESASSADNLPPPRRELTVITAEEIPF